MNCASSDSDLTVMVYNDDATTTLGVITWAYGTHGTGASTTGLPDLATETGLSLNWSSASLDAADYKITVSDANSLITEEWTITVADCVSATISAN